VSASSNLETAAKVHELAQEAVECIGTTRIFLLAGGGLVLTLFDFRNTVVKIVPKSVS
jgi:hypothetical protein